MVGYIKDPDRISDYEGKPESARMAISQFDQQRLVENPDDQKL